MSDSPAPSAPAAPAAPAPASNTSGASAPNAQSIGHSGAKGADTPPSGAAKATSTLPHGGSDAGDAAPANNHPEAAPGETKAETVQRLKFKHKVDGKEVEREYTMDEVALRLQKAEGAEARFSDAAKIQKTFQSFIKAVQEDPFGAFNDPAFGDLGKNYKQMVIDRLAKEFTDADLQKADPQGFELQKLREEKAQWEAAKKAESDAKAAAVQKEANDRMWAETQKSWNAALEASGLGTNPMYEREMAQIGVEFLERGLDLDPKLLVAEMRNRMGMNQKTLFAGLKGEQLVNALGEDLVNELLTYKVEQVKKARGTQEPIKAPAAAPVSPENDDEKPRGADSLRSFSSFLRSK